MEKKISEKWNYKRTAEVIGVPIGTVYYWVSKGEIPHLRLGNRLVRFDSDEIKL